MQSSGPPGTCSLPFVVFGQHMPPTGHLPAKPSHFHLQDESGQARPPLPATLPPPPSLALAGPHGSVPQPPAGLQLRGGFTALILIFSEERVLKASGLHPLLSHRGSHLQKPSPRLSHGPQCDGREGPASAPLRLLHVSVALCCGHSLLLMALPARSHCSPSQPCGQALQASSL